MVACRKERDIDDDDAGPHGAIYVDMVSSVEHRGPQEAEIQDKAHDSANARGPDALDAAVGGLLHGDFENKSVLGSSRVPPLNIRV